MLKYLRFEPNNLKHHLRHLTWLIFSVMTTTVLAATGGDSTSKTGLSTLPTTQKAPSKLVEPTPSAPTTITKTVTQPGTTPGITINKTGQAIPSTSSPTTTTTQTATQPVTPTVLP